MSRTACTLVPYKFSLYWPASTNSWFWMSRSISSRDLTKWYSRPSTSPSFGGRVVSTKSTDQHFGITTNSHIQATTSTKIACLTYEVLTTGQPYYLRSLLHYYTPHRTLRSVNQRLLEQPQVSTEFGKWSFSHLSSKKWNSLPLELQLAPIFDTFRRRLKTYLFG